MVHQNHSNNQAYYYTDDSAAAENERRAAAERDFKQRWDQAFGDRRYYLDQLRRHEQKWVEGRLSHYDHAHGKRDLGMKLHQVDRKIEQLDLHRMRHYPWIN